MKLSKCLKRTGATYVHKLIACTLGLYNYTLRTLCMYSGLRWVSYRYVTFRVEVHVHCSCQYMFGGFFQLSIPGQPWHVHVDSVDVNQLFNSKANGRTFQFIKSTKFTCFINSKFLKNVRIVKGKFLNDFRDHWLLSLPGFRVCSGRWHCNLYPVPASVKKFDVFIQNKLSMTYRFLTLNR